MQSLTAFPFTSELTYDSGGWPQLDRAVDAETLRKLISNYYKSGVFLTANASCFQVSAPSDASASVSVAPGVGLINGATGYTTAQVSLPLAKSDAALPRIDSVVLRINDNTDFRNMYLDVIAGTPASTPTAPTLTRSDSIWELGLADVYRAANSSTVTASNITDTRLDSERCGQVSVFEDLNTEGFTAQLKALTEEYGETFEQWFTTVQDTLDGDTAGNLLNLINTNTSSIETVNATISAAQTEVSAFITETRSNAPRDILNTIVTASSFTAQSSGTPTGYTYRAEVSDTRVSADTVLELYPSQSTNDLGVLSCECDSFDGGFYIYASEVPSQNLVFNRIVARKENA